MGKTFSITDILAAYFRSSGSMREPQNSAVLVGDLWKIIHNASESHPELQYIEKTYRGRTWYMNSAKKFTDELKTHLKKNCHTFFEVEFWGANGGIPVVRCKFDDAQVRTFWTFAHGTESIWTSDVENITPEENEIFTLSLQRFKSMTADQISELVEEYNERDRFI